MAVSQPFLFSGAIDRAALRTPQLRATREL